MRKLILCIGVAASAVFGLAPCASAEGLALGPWQVSDGAYRVIAPTRLLYYLTDLPYINQVGTVEATVTVKRRVAPGGWAAAAVLISSDPESFWTLSLVEGPGGTHYVELIELYQGIHQAQNAGATRLSPIEGAHGAEWEYGRPYRLRLSLTRERIVGEVFEAGQAEPIARLGWLLPGATALRNGWGALRAEVAEAEFTNVRVEAPQPEAPAAPPRQYPQGPLGCVAVYLGDDLPDAEAAPTLRVLQTSLEKAGFAFVHLTSTDLGAPSALPFPGIRYLAADARRMPAAALPPLLRWIQQGGVLVSLTAPAFGEFLYRSGDQWLTWEGYSQHRLEALGKNARPVVGWSAAELARWQQGAFPSSTKTAATAVQEGSAPGGEAALDLTVSHFDSGWWTMGRTFETPPASGDERLTCFWAKGDGKTPEVSLEWTEQDGSRWIAVVSLDPTWRCYVLPPQAFVYWQDNPSKGRGGPGDGLRLEHAVAMHFGISSSHTPAVLSTDAGEHHIWFGAIAFAQASPEALADLAPAMRPDMEALSPGYKLFAIRDAVLPREQARRWEPTTWGRMWGLEGMAPERPALAAIERPGGEGFDRGRWWRWVPLLSARDARGADLGAPVSLLLSEMLPMPRCAWVSLGLRELANVAEPEVQRTAAAAIARIATAPFLFEGGAQHFLFRPGEEIPVGARVVNHAATRQETRVEFRVSGSSQGRGDRPLVTLDATTPPRGMSVVRGVLAALPEGEYRMQVRLVKDGRTIDEVAHPLSVRARRTSPPPADEIVRREGDRLLLSGKLWHPVGCNYWPHNLGGMPTGAYWTGWLDPMNYDPEIAEADLAQMERWGFAAIAGVGADVSGTAEEDSPTLRDLEDFLWRCQRHHIKVFLFCRGLDPRARDDTAAGSLIRAVRHHPALAGYDIAWEPGYWGARQAYAGQWRTWLAEQYGSITEAEKLLGHSLPRTEQGEAGAPPDEWCETSGPWDALVAAYRVFWNHQLGAEYRRSAALVHGLDPAHLVGFRGSNVTSPLNFKPVEQPAVLHFMDWAGPEGYDVPAYGRLTPWEQVSAKGLVTRMLSFISGRKPVVWMEFGMPVYPNGTTWHDDLVFITPERYAYQVEEGRRWWQMQVDSGAWGSLVWWYPGGFRVGENSDCGLVDPSNLPRPVADTARSFVPRFRASEPYEPDAWLDFRPEADPGGWVGEYLRLRDEYARLVAEGHRVGVRTAGVGTTSADCPLVDPAGRPWPGKGPLRYLGAMFDRVRVRAGDGPWQELSLPTSPGAVEVTLPGTGAIEVEAWAGNLGEAEWLPSASDHAGSVHLRVAGDAKADVAVEARTPLQASGRFGPFRLTERLARPLRLRLQLEAQGRAPFGEALDLLLSPAP